MLGSPAVWLGLQVLENYKRNGGSHGYAEGETCDQPRDALPVHLPSLLISGPGILVEGTCDLHRSLRRSLWARRPGLGGQDEAEHLRHEEEATPEATARTAAVIAIRRGARLLIVHFTFLWWGGGRKV